MSNTNKVYINFIGFVKELYDLRKISDLLDWDQQTYMPPGGIKDRSNEIATISGIYHEKLTSKIIGRYIKKLSQPKIQKDLTLEEKANIREMTRLYNRESKIPASLVKEIAKISSLSTDAWVKARKKSNFKDFQPWLERMVCLKKKVAEAIGYKERPYDTLIDDFEPYITVRDIDPLFSDLERHLVPIVKTIAESKTKIDDKVLNQAFDMNKQQEFGIRIIKDMGFDFEHGRVDASAHPFTTGSCGDVRLTTFQEDHKKFSLFALMHEAGHGLYEQGYKSEHYRTPMANAVSLGYHESQSRLWENLIGKSLPFWKYFYPKLQKIFPDQLRSFTIKDFYVAINKVRPSFIRIEADEVTYNLHILLRYDIEKKLFDDKLEAKEIPQAWDQKMQDYLGIVPPNDALGVLQDIHWSQGLFGYFPTYALGNLYAVQLFNQAKKDIPNLEDDISKGKLLNLKRWLNQNIHKYGKLYSAKDLTKNITGEPLKVDHFISYLKIKFAPLYGVSF
jgi:carboxypeptidase Taq